MMAAAKEKKFPRIAVLWNKTVRTSSAQLWPPASEAGSYEVGA